MNLEYIDVLICLQENGLNTDYYTSPAEIAVAKDFLSHYKSTPLGIGRIKHDDKIFNDCITNGIYHRKSDKDSFTLKPKVVKRILSDGEEMDEFHYDIVRTDSEEGVATLSEFTNLGVEIRRIERYKDKTVVYKRDKDNIRVHVKSKEEKEGKTVISEFITFIDPRIDRGATLDLGPQYREEAIIRANELRTKNIDESEFSEDDKDVMDYIKALSLCGIKVGNNIIQVRYWLNKDIEDIVKKEKREQRITEADEEWHI